MSKAVWGPATWSMLHCLVLKIDDSQNIESVNHLEPLKQLINSICVNLPCPYCADHARDLIKNSNFLQINNILTLRNFIFQMHNKVNERLKKPIMDYSTHLEKYKNVKLVDVINTFIKVYNNNGGITMMLYSFYKKQVIIQLRQYFNNYVKLYSLN